MGRGKGFIRGNFRDTNRAMKYIGGPGLSISGGSHWRLYFDVNIQRYT